MYVLKLKILKSFSGKKLDSVTHVYVNFDFPFKREYEHSDIMMTQHANLVYEMESRKIIKNRDRVELTDELMQLINDVWLIDEL